MDVDENIGRRSLMQFLTGQEDPPRDWDLCEQCAHEGWRWQVGVYLVCWRCRRSRLRAARL